MRTIKAMVTVVMLMTGLTVAAKDKIRVAVLNIETLGSDLNYMFATKMFRNELKHCDTIYSIGKSEGDSALEANGIRARFFDQNNTKYMAGKAMRADVVITGKLKMTRDQYTIILESYDPIKEDQLAKVKVSYVKDPDKLEEYIHMALSDLFSAKNAVVELSGSPAESENKKEPVYTKQSLSGPRLGYTFMTGDMAQLFKAPTQVGGYDLTPAFFQFGYQFEARYMANGEMQGLVEFIPTITGMDQARMFPSLTILNGLRNTRYGIELAIGPTIYFKREARGYYDNTGAWHLQYEWNGMEYDQFGNAQAIANPYPIINRVDSRGDVKLTSGVVIALGKTFTSGNLNIPVNAYMVPGKNGWRFGLSFGFNLKNAR